MSKGSTFSGFSENTFDFLKRLKANNNVKWFDENREDYKKYLVEPSRSFVTSLAPFFNQLNPAIRTEPKFNKTLMRINKDMRFAKGDPYRNYFLIHFGRFKMDSEFYVFLNSDSVQYGLFLNNSSDNDLYFNDNIKKNEKEIIKTFKNFKINNKFDLYELDKEPGLLKKKFNAEKDFEKLVNLKYILLQKVISPSNKKLQSAAFINEAIKTFSLLYPVYCFGISPEPLKLIDKFEERMGVAEV